MESGAQVFMEAFFISDDGVVKTAYTKEIKKLKKVLKFSSSRPLTVSNREIVWWQMLPGG